MNSPDQETVVEGLRGLRRHIGLTQEQVARRMGVRQQSVQRMERNWPNVHMSSLLLYVKACGGGVSVIADLGYRQFVIR